MLGKGLVDLHFYKCVLIEITDFHSILIIFYSEPKRILENTFFLNIKGTNYPK